MPKFERWVRGKEDFASFPVLAALAQRPMSTLELSHVLLTTRTKVRERLVALEDKGWVVQRAGDKRWVMIVRLVATGIPEPRGVDGVTPGADIPVTAGPPTGRIVLEPAGDARITPGESVVDRPPSVAPQRQPEPRRADPEKISAHFGVPAALEEGGVGIGAVEPCLWCGGRTPLKYGETPICPSCARVAGAKPKEEVPS